MAIKLLFDRVIVKPSEDTEFETVGIKFTQGIGSNRGYGVVMHVGSEVTSVAVGDKILYNKTQKDEVFVGDEQLDIMVERNIDAII